MMRRKAASRCSLSRSESFRILRLRFWGGSGRRMRRNYIKDAGLFLVSRAGQANAESYVLRSHRKMRDRGRPEAGARVQLPKFLRVGCVIGAEHSVGTALEDEIGGGRENSPTFAFGKRDAPYLMLLSRIPS